MTVENKSGNKFWSELFLTVTEGPGKGARHHLVDGENVIGRVGSIRIDVEGVSRQHAGITVGEDLVLEDLGSTSGTMLNSRMLVGKDFVFDGDEIRLGTLAMRLTAKRRENRASIIGALLAILVGAVLLGGGLLLQDYLTSVWRQRYAQRQVEERREALPTWRDWNNLEFPSRNDLEGENVNVDATSALVEFNFGQQLFNDRMLDPGNAHSAIIHFKRCLGILENISDEARPAVANRAITHLADLQTTIAENCNTKVFAFVRARQMRYWQGCYDALNLIIKYVPNPNDPYHMWAREQIAILNARLKR